MSDGPWMPPVKVGAKAMVLVKRQPCEGKIARYIGYFGGAIHAVIDVDGERRYAAHFGTRDAPWQSYRKAMAPKEERHDLTA